MKQGQLVRDGVSIGQIMAAATAASGIRQLWGRGRTPDITVWRFVAWHTAVEMGFAYAAIGHMSDRDHTSIIHGVRRAKKQLEVDETWRARRDALLIEIEKTPSRRSKVVALALAEMLRLEARAQAEIASQMELEPQCDVMQDSTAEVMQQAA